MVNRFLNFVFKGINSNGIEYFFAIGKISTIPAVFIMYVQNLTDWYILNEDYINWILVVLSLDHILGSYVHFKFKRDFKIEKNLIGLLTKIMVVIASYAVTESIRDTLEEVSFIAEYLSVVIKVSILLYPAYPAIKNIDVISGGKSPFSWLIKAIENFQNDGDLSHFATTKDPNRTPSGYSESFINSEFEENEYSEEKEQ